MREFVWVDGERTIHFGPAADAVGRLGGPGFTLLTTLSRDLDDPSYAYSWYEEGAEMSTTG